MASDAHHEPIEFLSEHTKDMHRALTSLMEELEAIDWYQQRAEATQDPQLRAVLAHNRDEETEHAAMLLEWLRQKSPVFDEKLRTFLMKTAPNSHLGAPRPGNVDGSLGVGSLKDS